MAGKEKTAGNRKRKVNFIFSYDDLLILNKLMTHTYCFDLKLISERGMGVYKKFSIFAPRIENSTWYRGEGFSLVEAVENWIERTTKEKGSTAE